MLARCVLLALGLSLTSGCAGEAPTDSDPTRADAAGDAATDAVDDDTGTTADDTGSVAPETSSDAAGDASDASDASEDARPTCTGSDPEPNNSIPSATPLKAIDDCDGSGSSFKGVVAGGTDADFFTYAGSDKIGCVVDASASTKSAGVRLCVFVSCGAGITEIKNCVKGTRETSPGGVQGCCTNGPGDVEVEHVCTLVGTDDAANVYMRVDAPGSGSTCTPYEVSYHF